MRDGLQCSVRASASASFGLADVEGEHGSATVRQGLALAGADRSFGPEGFVVQPRVSICAGAHVLGVDGHVPRGAPGLPRSDAAVAFAAAAGGGVGFAVSDGARVVLDGSVVLVLPEPVVTIVEPGVACAGLPFFTLSAGLEVRP